MEKIINVKMKVLKNSLDYEKNINQNFIIYNYLIRNLILNLLKF